jgi:heat shock protein HslJ
MKLHPRFITVLGTLIGIALITLGIIFLARSPQSDLGDTPSVIVGEYRLLEAVEAIEEEVEEGQEARVVLGTLLLGPEQETFIILGENESIYQGAWQSKKNGMTSITLESLNGEPLGRKLRSTFVQDDTGMITGIETLVLAEEVRTGILLEKMLPENITGDTDDASEVTVPLRSGNEPRLSATPTLDGTWAWQESRSGEEVVAPASFGQFVITIDNGRMSIATDCNNGFGSVTESGNQLTVGPLASTLMFCENSQEQTFTSQLQNVSLFRTLETGLELVDETNQLTMNFIQLL